MLGLLHLGFKSMRNTNLKTHIAINEYFNQTDLLTSSTPSGNLRDVANSRATVSSAVASVRTSGVYPTRMPLKQAKNNDETTITSP